MYVYLLSVEEECDRYLTIKAFSSQEKALRGLDDYLASHGYTYRVADCECDGVGDESLSLVQIFNDGFYADIRKMEVI